MTIVEFLTARLDEAESGWKTQRRAEADGCTEPVFHFGRPLAEEMLADIAAKRSIVTRYASAVDEASKWRPTQELTAVLTALEWPLKNLAEVYRDHSDYSDEWRP